MTKAQQRAVRRIEEEGGGRLVLQLLPSLSLSRPSLLLTPPSLTAYLTVLAVVAIE